jgi:hypothetical protein
MSASSPESGTPADRPVRSPIVFTLCAAWMLGVFVAYLWQFRSLATAILGG